MKFWMSLLIVTLAAPLFANQPYNGPLLSREIGKEQKNLGLTSSCQLFANNADIDWKEVRKDIERAIKESRDPNNFDKRTYVQFNAPSKKYVAYQPIQAPNQPPNLHQVELLSDGGSFSALNTDSGKRLLNVISENCGALKKNQAGFDAESEESDK